jgi:hypothetical protein
VTDSTKHCWPTRWLEAAERAGFAEPKGEGEYYFQGDDLRKKLEIFAAGIRTAALKEDREA